MHTLTIQSAGMYRSCILLALCRSSLWIRGNQAYLRQRRSLSQPVLKGRAR